MQCATSASRWHASAARPMCGRSMKFSIGIACCAGLWVTPTACLRIRNRWHRICCAITPRHPRAWCVRATVTGCRGRAICHYNLWRHRLGLGSHGIIVGVFGIVCRNKRVGESRRGFERYWRTCPDSLLVIVGNCYDTTYHKKALAAHIHVSPARARMVIADYAPPDVFHAVIGLSES